MPLFVWEGKTRTGDIKRGEMDAPDNATVMLQLRKQQIFPTKVKVKVAKRGILIGGRVKEKDIVNTPVCNDDRCGITSCTMS